MKDISESTIGNEAEKIFERDYSINWSKALTIDTIADVFISMAQFLGQKKSKDKPVAVELRDQNGNFHFGAYVTFIPQQESGADEGSWTLNYTFDESNIEPDWTKYDLMLDSEAFMVYHDIAYFNHGIAWRFANTDTNERSEGTPAHLIPILFDILKRYMELNATTSPELSIGERAYLRAELGSGGVFISITPNAVLKSYIKDDQAMGIIG